MKAKTIKLCTKHEEVDNIITVDLVNFYIQSVVEYNTEITSMSMA